MSVVAPAGQVSAPVAPGRMGSALELQAAHVYLDELGEWRDARRHELDELDKGAMLVEHRLGGYGRPAVVDGTVESGL